MSLLYDDRSAKRNIPGFFLLALTTFILISCSGDMLRIIDEVASDEMRSASRSGSAVELKPTIHGFQCGSDVSFTYMGERVTYGTLYKHGLCWMDRNLGAEKLPQNYDDEGGYGHLFQWGRSADGHQLRESRTSSGPVETSQPGHNRFITNSGAGSATTRSWNRRLDYDLWKGYDAENGVCPDGWRIPLIEELRKEKDSWRTGHIIASFRSDERELLWPLSGIRNANGVVLSTGRRGYVWSANVTGEQTTSSLTGRGEAISWSRNSKWANIMGTGVGLPVRCVSDLAPEPEPEPEPDSNL
ncbi:MAG: fibrobacter succinogenes major paralogous domain-containing protein [Balneolia bacterium]|nr:fibrobacter succinogenes major paralogous domain-containing protein [Balneolia bacterium]